jgi:general secretion pathway protein G
MHATGADMRLALRIVVLAAAFATANCQVARAKESVLRQQLWEMRAAIDTYQDDHSALPPTLDVLVAKNYLRSIPIDPITNSASTWRLIRDRHQGRTVRSGSDRVSPLMGTRYSDW